MRLLPCPKEAMGYTCRHGFYLKNGKKFKECDGTPAEE